MNRHLKNSQWNAFSIKSRADELNELAHRLRADVVVVCETKLTGNDKFYFKGYSISVKTGIKYSKFNIKTNSLEQIGIKIDDIHIFSLCKRPAQILDPEDLFILLQNGNKAISRVTSTPYTLPGTTNQTNMQTNTQHGTLAWYAPVQVLCRLWR